MRFTPSKITIHCTATPNGKNISKDFLEFVHVKQNGWRKIGYHFVIEPDGSHFIGREINEIGSHVAEHNRNNVGIALVGMNQFTLIQFKTLRQILDDLRDRFFIAAGAIFCHYELDKKGKTCPNIKIDDLIRWYVQQEQFHIEQYLLKH